MVNRLFAPQPPLAILEALAKSRAHESSLESGQCEPLPCSIFGEWGIPAQQRGEQAEYESARLQAVMHLVSVAWSAARYHFGRDQAVEMFKRAAAGKPGRPRGSAYESTDAILIELIESELADGPDPAVIPRVAREVHAMREGAFGASAKALEMRLRRRLKEREVERAEVATSKSKSGKRG